MPAMLPSTGLKASAPRTIAFSVLNSPAHPYRYRRFVCPLTGTDARLAEKRGLVIPSFQRTFTSCLLPVRLAHQPDACLHAGLSAHEVPLEAEVVIDPAVDPLEGGAAPVAAAPRRAAVRGRREDPPVVPGQRDAHDPPVRAGRAPGAAVAARPACADLAPGGGRTAVLERGAAGLEALEGHRPLGSGHGADATHLALLRVHDGVGPPGIEGARALRRRVTLRDAFLFAPQVPGRDQGADLATGPTGMPSAARCRARDRR